MIRSNNCNTKIVVIGGSIFQYVVVAIILPVVLFNLLIGYNVISIQVPPVVTASRYDDGTSQQQQQQYMQQQQSQFHVARSESLFHNDDNLQQHHRQLAEAKKIDTQNDNEPPLLNAADVVNKAKNWYMISANMTRKERLKKEKELVKQLHDTGFHDTVGHTAEAALLRKYHLRKKKHKRGGSVSSLISAALRHRTADQLQKQMDESDQLDTDATDSIQQQQYNTRGRTNNNNRQQQQQQQRVRNEASMMDILFPGMKPELYRVDEIMYIITDQVRSRKTHVPYEYYDTIPGCPVRTSLLKKFKRVQKRHHRNNLGARLQGSDFQPAPFTVRAIQNETCTILCTTALEIYQVRFLQKLIQRQYRVHIQLDQLPVLMRNSNLNYAVRGYPIGFHTQSVDDPQKDEYYLYNHLKFTITYQRAYITTTGRRSTTRGAININSQQKQQQQQPIVRQRHRRLEQTAEGDTEEGDVEEDTQDEENDTDTKKSDTVASTLPMDGIYITGFDVYPVSMKHSDDGTTCTNSKSSSNPGIQNDPKTYLPLSALSKDGKTLNVHYTYEVEWIESHLPWEDRWDVYLMGSPDDDIHVFAIVNSFMIVLFLSGTIATIMIRTLRKEIRMYNEIIDSNTSTDIMAEESGWKLLHGDVFRPPSYQYPMLLACFVGTGTQISCAALFTLFLSLLNIVNPIKKGQTLTAVLALFVLSGCTNGYISARIYKFCGAKHWKINTITSAIALPGIFVSIFIVLNICLRIEKAATAVSFLTLFQVFAMWAGISAPLVFVGSFFGYRAEKISVPTKTNPIARYVPRETIPWYLQPPISFCIGGILPFGSICIELFFIMSALWLHQFYYVMGFLLAVLLILAATCAQVSIVMDYLQLCAEDYNWWWKSFFNCASAGGYLFVYSLWFLYSKLELVGLLSVTIYLTYMAMISISFALFCGSIGFICSFWFNRTIYGALHKVD